MTNSAVAIMDTLDWDELVSRYWDRQPVLIKQLPAAPFEAAEVFEAAAAASAGSDTSPVMPPHIRFSVGRYQQLAPAGWLPAPADSSLAGYQKRITEQLAGERYALVVSLFHIFHTPQWCRERAFYAGLWERVGIPLTSAITTMFHGSYEHSPVGVHLDRFATFMYVVAGRKRMRFWADRPWSAPVATMLDYESYLDSSFAVEVEPGQLLYWPANYHHVGESALGAHDQPATSVNVGVPRYAHRAANDIDDYLYELTPEVMTGGQAGLGLRPPRPGGLLVPADQAGAELPEQLPPEFADALRTLAGDATRSTAAEAGGSGTDRDVELSLQRWASGGFRPAPPPAATRPLPPGTGLRAVAPIYWAPGEATRFCAANGHVVRTTLAPDRLRELIAELTPGPVLTDRLADPERQLLQALASFHALEQCGPN